MEEKIGGGNGGRKKIMKILDTNVVASRERRQTETPTARAKSSDNFQSILSLTI